MKTILFATFSIISLFTFSQNPSILWQNKFGGNNNDFLMRVESPSGGYYFMGDSDSDISGDKTDNSRGFSDIWIVKTDANYTIQWDKTIGGDQYDNFEDVVIINDTIYIVSKSSSDVSGEKTTPHLGGFGYTDLWFLALDLNGNILWQSQYGGNMDEFNPRLKQLSNGNLLLVCNSTSGATGNKADSQIGFADIWICELDRGNGNIIQQNTIGSVNQETFVDFIELTNGDYLLKGGAQQGISGDKTDNGYGAQDIWLVRLDNSLNVLTDKCFGGNLTEDGIGGSLFEDNGFIYMSCSSTSDVSGNKTAPNQGSWSGTPKSDYWIIKTDLNLNIIWDKTFGGNNDEGSGVIDKYEFNKLVVDGWSLSVVSGNKTSVSYGDYDLWMLILDLDGNIIAQETYGGSGIDGGFIQKQTDATKLFISAFSDSGISGIKTVPSYGGFDYWFMELDASNFLNTEQIEGTHTTISVYPNPFNSEINFKFSELEQDVHITFYNVNGQIIIDEYVKQGNTMSILSLPSGQGFVYYEVTGETINYKGKLIQY